MVEKSNNENPDLNKSKHSLEEIKDDSGNALSPLLPQEIGRAHV
mgnify:CR=1 FL=1